MTQQRDENYLTTAEVARRLNVQPATIYAYVSRGQLTSVRARGQRGSLFAKDEVERLAGRHVEHPGVVERIETNLTLLQDDELYYRGHSARKLTQITTIESVAHLLWTGELGEQPSFPAPKESVELVRAAMAGAPPTARMTDQLRIGVAVLGASDPLRFGLAPESVIATAGRLIGVLVDALPGPVEEGTLGHRLWAKLTTRQPHPAVVDDALILLADHGLAISTIAARVAASARANLYSVVSAGLGALDGQYHGAATTQAYRFLERALQDPVEALSDQLRSGTHVPGFGHLIYKERDPRAEVLLDQLPHNPAIRQIIDSVPTFPNSDLAIAALMHTYDFRPDAGEALFAIARIIGWTAHALEEYAEPGLRFRVSGVYTGPPIMPLEHTKPD